MPARESDISSVDLKPASDTSSICTPEYTPASTPQLDGRKSTEFNMGETSKDATKVVSEDTAALTTAKDQAQADTQPIGEATDAAGKDAKDQQQQQQQQQSSKKQVATSGAAEHKPHVRCKREASKHKVKKSKKGRRGKTRSGNSSHDSDSDAEDSSDDSSSESSNSSESESESKAATSSSSSDSSSEEEEQQRKRRSKKAKKSGKGSKKSRRNKKRHDTSSEDSDAEDESSSSSESEEEPKRSKKSKKRNRRRRKTDSEPEEGSSENEESTLEEARDYLKNLGLKAKGLKAVKKPARDESSDSEVDRRSSRRNKRSKRDGGSKKDDSNSGSNSKKPKFFRGDELWDNDNHQFEVKPTKSRLRKESSNEYVFTVKRKFNWEGKYEYTVVDLHAKPLRDCLQKIMESCKSVSLAEDEPTLDPNMLFLYLEDMREYRKSLKANLNSGMKIKKKTKKLVMTKIAQLRCMIKYLDKDYASTKATLNPMLKEGVITFDLLWTLFRSDTLVYSTTYSNESEPRSFKVEYCTREESFTRGIYYEISGKYFDFDGRTFGLGNVQADISQFKGVRKINSLACYPLTYHSKCEEMKKQLVERGKKFVSLAGMQYKFLKGMAFMKRRGNIIRINVNGRIMCDPATFRRINPNYPISNVKKEDPDLLSACSDSECESDRDAPAPQADACTCPDCLALDPNAFAQQRVRDDEPKKRWKRVYDPKTKMFDYIQVPVDDNGNEIRNLDQPPGNASFELQKKGGEDGDGNDDSDDNENIPGKDELFTEEDLLIASPVILGFAFSEKLWLELSVSGIQEISWNEGAFDSLVLPMAQKNIIQALVTAHAAESKADSRAEASGEAEGKISGGHHNIDDVIQGKGKGLVAVLHGSPGTGKTLTAEGIAELRRCPLYCVSAGELGTNPRELEAELTKILDVAHVWGAVLLLDEADVFLEARTAQDIHRNALVSIFLRLLEYFQGILFLTTNRVSSFDEAFQSRIHIALRYQELDMRARRKVWEMFLDRVRQLPGARVAAFGKDEMDRLSRKSLNGRQIKNAVRSAQALAINEAVPLAMQHIDQVLEVAESFDRDLKGGSGWQDAMRSYN